MNLTDRFKAALEALVLRIAGKYDYAIPYACKVISQNSDDGTLELQPDSPTLPGLSRVPIRYGAPGETATVGVGARCFVVFENAEPSKPVVAGWDLSSPLVMLTLGGGSQPVSRVGDLVQSAGPGTVVTLIPVTGVGAPPNNAVVAGLPHLISFGSVTSPPSPAGDPLMGVIITGATNVQS